MKNLFTFAALLLGVTSFAQTNPAITGWLQNTTGITGRHYVAPNPTPVVDAVLANVQSVRYDDNYVYVAATGIPAYITGPFQDGNPSLATAQNRIFRITLNPTPNTGTGVATTGVVLGATYCRPVIPVVFCNHPVMAALVWANESAPISRAAKVNSFFMVSLLLF